MSSILKHEICDPSHDRHFAFSPIFKILKLKLDVIKSSYFCMQKVTLLKKAFCKEGK